MKLSRGDVALARFPHASGGRGKRRPVVVVQADGYNEKLRHVIVAEVTSNLSPEKARLRIDASSMEGQATGLAHDCRFIQILMGYGGPLLAHPGVRVIAIHGLLNHVGLFRRYRLLAGRSFMLAARGTVMKAPRRYAGLISTPE